VIETHISEVDRLGTVELRIPAQAEWVAVARLAISAAANRLAFSLEEIEDLKLALTEACTNCIQQADADAIDITIDVLVAEMRVIVRDHVRHARERAVVVPIAAQLHEERTESVGIYIIRSLMDLVEQRSDGAAGTELVMIKRVQQT
jgi:serine/threonine-protein kinase RsbW